MKILAPAVMAALPLMAVADVNPDANAPGVATPFCIEAPQPDAKNLFALPTPLQHAVLLLALAADANPQPAPRPDLSVDVLRMWPMPDNTWRSAWLDCAKLEVHVEARDGLIDATRWYGPYKVAELMSARGGAAPQFP